MNENLNASFDKWLRQARRDVAAAVALYEKGFEEWAVFLAHQAAERALKAYLYLHGTKVIVGHAIRALVHKCAQISPTFEVIHDAGRLDELYRGPRFPDAFGTDVPQDTASAEDAEAAVELARMTVELVDKLGREGGF